MSSSSYSEWSETFQTLYGEYAGQAVWQQHARFAQSSAATPDQSAAQYRDLVAPEARHALGEFFTPSWLADITLDCLDPQPHRPLLDPAAGLGVFVERASARGLDARGFEINPVTAARARAMGLHVEVRNTLNDPGEQRFDYIAGNPPWVNWRHLNPAYRARIAPLWEHYKLVPRGRLGGAMDDLSILFTYACADRLLAPGGRMAFVLSRTLFQSAGGGRAFRRFELPSGQFLRVLQVHEIDGVSAFSGASTQAVIAVFEVSDQPTLYPVPYIRKSERWNARPVSHDPASAWAVTRCPANHEAMRGQSPYVARVGAHSGGASGVFWVDEIERRGGLALIRNRNAAGRNSWPQITAEVESELVRHLIRGRDVSANRATPSCSILLPHGPGGRPIAETVMRDRFPRAFAYFEHFRAQMSARPHYLRHFKPQGLPYWSMYNVGAYTFAPHRVVWREQHKTLACAVVDRPDWIADAKLVVVPCDSHEEAHYLAALLNSAPAREFVESYAVRIQISTHVLRNLRVPKYDPCDPLHAELAVPALPARIDQIAASLWGISA
jgi:hypothetical protein